MVDTPSLSHATRAARIEAALRAAFDVQSLRLEDESALHEGHAGASGAGETHFRVRVVATDFTAMNRIARHRAVNSALAAEFDTGLHALAIEALTPEQDAAATA